MTTSAKNVFKKTKKQKTSERFRMLPNASERIRTCPNASGQVRTGPSTSQKLRKPRKSCENFAKNFAKVVAVMRSCNAEL